jgi:uncharacterized protein YjbI with pentapeptide repeats
MANPEHLELLKQGIASWNEWRKGNPTSLPDLVRADLSMANLSSANLGRADLSGADLSGADLNRANLSDADLNRAYLSRAYLSRADLSDADFNQTRLIDTDLLFGRRSCHKNIDVTKYARMDPDNHFGDSNYCFQGSG